MIEHIYIGVVYGITGAAAVLAFVLTLATLWALIDLSRWLIELVEHHTGGNQRGGNSEER